jgi:hypothetical protein
VFNSIRQDELRSKAEARGGVARWDIFKTKNPNMRKFWRAFQSKTLVFFIVIGIISQPFGIFCGHLIYFTVVWYIFPRFGMLHLQKSGNPGAGGRGRGDGSCFFPEFLAANIHSPTSKLTLTRSGTDVTIFKIFST